MKFKTLPAVRRLDLEENPVLMKDGKSLMVPGEFCWWKGLPEDQGFNPKDLEHPILWYVTPEGYPYPLEAPVTIHKSEQDKVGHSGTYWWWNGDWDKPTLLPSIGLYNSDGTAYAWHGYLTDGVFVACE